MALLTTTAGWGIYYSLAVFFKDLQSSFNTNRADISLVSSIFIGTFFTMGIIYGRIVDKHSPRILVGLGGLAIFAGMLLSSQATAVGQLYIFLGFLAGAGTSAAILPFIPVLSRWFISRRGLVLDIQAAGAGVGMMIFFSALIKTAHELWLAYFLRYPGNYRVGNIQYFRLSRPGIFLRKRSGALQNNKNEYYKQEFLSYYSNNKYSRW